MKNDDLNYIDIFEYRNENFDCILDNVKVCNVSLDSLENLCYNLIFDSCKKVKSSRTLINKGIESCF